MSLFIIFLSYAFIDQNDPLIAPLSSYIVLERVQIDHEAELINLINMTRKANGLSGLVVDKLLMKSAREHGSFMSRIRRLTHTQRAVAENIAMGQISASEVLNDWMNSPGHRSNILGRYTRFGVARTTSVDNRIFWCAQFK